MPWLDGEFDVTADQNGQIIKESELTAPVSGKLTHYRIKTETSCENRSHETTVTIERVDDPSDRIVVGPIGIVDCIETERPINYKVRQSKNYKVKLESKGFRPGEQVKGKAGLKYILGLL